MSASPAWDGMWRLSGGVAGEHVIPSLVAEAHRVQQEILQLLRDKAFSDRDIFAVKLAVEEAVVNAIRHGNQLDPQKKIRIAYQVTEDAFLIRICDEGCGFDPDAVPDPTHEANLEKPSGRGLLLMRYYMTEVHFLDGGTTVVMCKRRGSG